MSINAKTQEFARLTAEGLRVGTALRRAQGEVHQCLDQVRVDEERLKRSLERLTALQSKVHDAEVMMRHVTTEKSALLGTGIVPAEVLPDQPESPVLALLRRPIKQFDFVKRVRTACRRVDLVYVGQLVQMDAKELLEIPNFGDTSLENVQAVLATHGLTLGMCHSDVPEIAAFNKWLAKIE